ncbi:MAG TPA: cyanophycin synthetase, partial [Candidatus Saccharimonadales bacterium]
SAVTEEHMGYFKTLDAVAAEELSVFDFAQAVLINGDDIPGKYLAGQAFLEYSTVSPQADYYARPSAGGLEGQTLAITMPKGSIAAAKVQYIGTQGAKFALAAAAVGNMLGMTPGEIKAGLQHLEHFAGRMQVLPGLDGSTLIDDTYNASPVAVKAALDVLYAAAAPQRIAVLGSMNELGDYSRPAHQEVGAYCDPEKLDVVVTIGTDAKRWLAPAAKKRGCAVESFLNPVDAGNFVRQQMKPSSVILVKGSQNGVFAEEALKPLLADPADAAKLVRQSDSWLRMKRRQFNV